MMLAVDGMTGNRWADLVIGAAAVVTAVGLLWRKVLRPVVRGVERLADATPVLFDIASQFHGNGGETLKDAITRIENRLASGGEQIASLLNNQGQVMAEQIEQGAKLNELFDYSHRNHHENVGRINGLGLMDEAINRKVDELGAKLDDIATAAAASDVQMAEHRESEADGRSE